MFPGGVLQDVCSEKRVLFIIIIIHPFTEMIPNVESPEKEREADSEAAGLPRVLPRPGGPKNMTVSVIGPPTGQHQRPRRPGPPSGATARSPPAVSALRSPCQAKLWTLRSPGLLLTSSTENRVGAHLTRWDRKRQPPPRKLAAQGGTVTQGLLQLFHTRIKMLTEIKTFDITYSCNCCIQSR